MDIVKKLLKEQQKAIFKKYENLVGIKFFGSLKRLKRAFTVIDEEKHEIIKHYNDKFFPQCDKKWAEEEYQRALDGLKREFRSEYIFYGVLIGTLIAAISTILLITLL